MREGVPRGRLMCKLVIRVVVVWSRVVRAGGAIARIRIDMAEGGSMLSERLRVRVVPGAWEVFLNREIWFSTNSVL